MFVQFKDLSLTFSHFDKTFTSRENGASSKTGMWLVSGWGFAEWRASPSLEIPAAVQDFLQKFRIRAVQL